MPSVISQVLEQSREYERAQRYQEAIELIARQRREHPDDRLLALRYGELLEATKQTAAALNLYRALVAAQPKTQEAELVLGLGRCLLRLGQLDQAVKMFSAVQQKLPTHPEVLVGLAACQRRKKDVLAARDLLARLSAQDALRPAALLERAHLQLAEKADAEAVQTLEQALERSTLAGEALDLWLATLSRSKRERYAQEKLTQWLQAQPMRVEYIFAFAVLAQRSGELAAARQAYEKADQLSPRNYKILYEWGVMERLAGDIPRSRALIERALELKPDQPSALRIFGNDHRYAYGDRAFTRLNLVAAGLTELEANDQVHLHYALGKAFEDAQELDTAFRHYAAAGRKKRKLLSYNERNSNRMFELMPRLVTAANLAKTGQQGFDSELPVFILGMPRSGTSLMEQVLSSHPAVFGAGELKYITGVVDNMQIGGTRLRLQDSEPFFPYEANASWEQRGRLYVEKLRALAGESRYTRVVDKMPGNFTMLGLIHAILPKARIIHSRRHPVEICLSCYRIHFTEGQEWSYNLQELGRYYRRYHQLMLHWKAQLPDAILEVRYEDMVADIEPQARRLIAHLGLPWDDACLEFHKTDRPVKTASASQVRKPIYQSSAGGRWRKFERHLQPLLDELGDLVTQYDAELAASGHS